jgi:Mn2+/Fe2+ NRAMP family transporter
VQTFAVKSNDKDPARGLRPGLVAGASANDPTTVGSLAVVGATTVYGLAWLVIAVLPMLAVTQMIAASVGAATTTSVQAAIVRRYGLSWGMLSLIAIVVVNLFTIVADVEAGGQSLSMVFHVPYQVFVVPFVAIIGALLITRSFSRIATLLMFLPILFVAYGLSAVLAHADWLAVLHNIVAPHIERTPEYFAGALALIGTTITSYEYVWESIEVSESGMRAGKLHRLWRDAVWGVVVAGAGFLFVLVATGATLGVHHLPIETADDAARALTPLAGQWAGLLFGLGLFGSALLTVPILASSTGYVFAHTFGWNGTLDAPFAKARAFYAIILLSLALAAAGSFIGLPPIRLLFWASIAGGFGTPITLVLMNAVARSRRSMGDHCVALPLSVAGWIVTGIVTFACAVFLISLVHP